MDLAQLNNPLMAGVAGLIIGLVLTFLVMVQARFDLRSLKKENDSLLRGFLSINDTGNKTLSAELEELKRKNENLRVTQAMFKNKPGKSGLRRLHIYDQAIRYMNARAPGFAPVWESTLAEAEAKMKQADTGIIAWVLEIIHPSLGNKPSQVTLLSATSQPSPDSLGSSVTDTHASSAARPNPAVHTDAAR